MGLLIILVSALPRIGFQPPILTVSVNLAALLQNIVVSEADTADLLSDVFYYMLLGLTEKSYAYIFDLFGRGLVAFWM
jgi:hypothetical protein